MPGEPQNWRVKLVAKHLFAGAMIAYPTEGVWGLGCIPEFTGTVQRILTLKKRSRQRGLILVASSIEQILPYCSGLTSDELVTLNNQWPGNVTYLLPRSDFTSDWIAGNSDRVAVRVTNHPVIRKICDEIAGPLVSTSANPSGKPAAGTILRVRQYFPSGIDYIFPGPLGDASGASEIRDLRSGETIREAAS